MKPLDGTSLLEADLTRVVIGGFFDAYNQLGRGFLESVYEGAMEVILKQAGLQVKRQYPLMSGFGAAGSGIFVRTFS